jgi:hypothetical protein
LVRATTIASQGFDHSERRPAVALRWAGGVAVVAIIAAVLSVIGGVITGIAASRYTGIGTDEFGDQVTQTRHHGDVVVFWIAVGVLTAALWMALPSV